MEAGYGAAVAAVEDKEEVQPKPADASGAATNKPICYETSYRSHTCEVAGDVRIVGSSQTIYVDVLDREWKTKPYCRKHDTFALSHVKEWSLKPLPSGDGAAPECTWNSSAHRFAGEVQFLVSSYRSWWMNKYIQIFQQMSRYKVVDIDTDDEVRCYRSAVVGPTFHKDLGVDPSKTLSGYSVVDFRKMLHNAFGLERAGPAC